MRIVNRMQFLITDASKWAVGKIWIWRIPLVAYLVWACYCHVSDTSANDLFLPMTVGVHEFARLVMSWCSQPVYAAAGSVAQILVPAGIAYYLLSQRDYFGVAAVGGWLGSSLFNLAAYIGDARPQQLPAVGLNINSISDWTYLLGTWNLLPYDTTIACATGIAATVVMLLSIVWGGWLCWVMITNPKPHTPVSQPRY